MLFVNMTKYLEREMAQAVEAGLKSMPAVIVTGMRQVGKSTMLMRHRAFRKRRYLTLDDMGTPIFGGRNRQQVILRKRFARICAQI